MMINTGGEMDIVYTTDSLIVTTSTDGLTSMVITKQKKSKLPCAQLSSILLDLHTVTKVSSPRSHYIHTVSTPHHSW